MIDELGTELEAIKRLSRDLAKAAATLGIEEVRFLVKGYYMLQDYRIASVNQVKSLTKNEKPHDVLTWFLTQSQGLEGQIKRALNGWASHQPLCQWAMSIVGIGPVLSSGLAAHIDVTKAPTVGHIWRFAGMDPTCKWQPKTKRPWNAQLKVICWKIGESFVKVSGNEKDTYGKIYLARKEYEQKRNSAGELAEQAKVGMERVKKSTEAYKHYSEGHLPPGHIHQRACRYAVKLFLAHYHHVAYELQYGVPPPKPYIIEHGGHVHFIGPPNWPATGQSEGSITCE